MPSRKKGQAAVKKAPRRTKGAATGGPRSGKKQAPKTNGSARGSDDEAPDGGEDEDEESDHGPYCICRGPDDHRFMIGCDICEDWFHGECVQIEKVVGENLIERFVCPNCADEDRGVRTVFKKTCSYRNCKKPARRYDGREANERSAFCSDDHTQMWWEKQLAALPKKSSVKPSMREELTQDEFLALLGSDLVQVDKTSGTLKITTRPYAASEDEGWWFPDICVVAPLLTPVSDDGTESKKPLAPGTLTGEEDHLIQCSAAERYRMGEEIVMCQKMLQLMDFATERRKALIASKQLDDTACGYDFRLDTVGVQAPFARFVNSDEGREIFRTNSLDHGSVLTGDEKNICDKKRCKPHQTWYGILSRDVKFQMKELAADAKKKLDRERDIREAAVERKMRKATEHYTVVRYDEHGNPLPPS